MEPFIPSLPYAGNHMKLSHLELFQNLVNLAAADGKFTEEEVLHLARRAEQWGISNDEFESTIAGIMEGELEMSRMMAIDGLLAELEKRLCATASAQMDFTTQEFKQLLDRVLESGTAG